MADIVIEHSTITGCDRCISTGLLNETICPECKGEGRVMIVPMPDEGWTGKGNEYIHLDVVEQVGGEESPGAWLPR